MNQGFKFHRELRALEIISAGFKPSSKMNLGSSKMEIHLKKGWTSGPIHRII